MKLTIVMLMGISAFGFTLIKQSSYQNTTYEEVKLSIDQDRVRLKSKYDSEPLPAGKDKVLYEAGDILLNSIVEKLIPHWYGTGWDFNGYTAIPQEGKIACGYFVSTLLQHSGFKLNRYKLAQQAASVEIKLLSSGDTIHTFYNSNREKFLSKIKSKLRPGLYVIGLDYHVGFLFIEPTEIYFIHSSYRDPVAVVKEKASESLALSDSHSFMLTCISSNKKLLKKWLCGEQLVVL